MWLEGRSLSVLLSLPPPMQENNLKVSSWRERVFDAIKLRDPFEPVVPRHLKRHNYFSAPFNYDKKTK